MAARGANERRAIRESLGQRKAETYGGRAKRAGPKLTPAERGDLEELWGISSRLGVRSVHGAIEDKLLRSPPRDDARNEIVAELERAGGRAPEGKVLRVVVVEGWATLYEARRAVQLLALHGRLERIEVPMPPGEPAENDPSGLTFAQREWTGFDLRLVGRERGELTMRLALVRTKTAEEARRERWRAQDEELEREWRIIECGEGESFSPFGQDDPEIGPNGRAKLERATRALAAMTPLHARVIRALFEDTRPRETEADVVARTCHVPPARALALIEEAFEAYRVARKEVIACRAR